LGGDPQVDQRKAEAMTSTKARIPGGRCLPGFFLPKNPRPSTLNYPPGHGLEPQARLLRGRFSRKGMRIIALVLTAIALGAAAPPAQVYGDPVALITTIYNTYTEIAPDADGMPGLPGIYSKRLQALVDKDEKETPEGEVGRIDWDLFVDGQDWQLTELKIVPVSQSTSHAEVRATFKNFGEAHDILYTLVLENGQWRIDDIQETLKPRWTMSKILVDAADAFPDAEPDEK
jgi:Protein of unknown function (DUF3828)